MQNKRCIYYLLLMLLYIIQSSCEHYSYVPNSNNVPLFKEKNESRLQAQYNVGKNFSGFEVQSAYAVSNHAALQLNFHHATNKNELDWKHSTYIEAAGGYYSPSPHSKLIFETYGGFGYGSLGGDLKPDEANSYFKFFVQPSYGFSSKHFEFALSSKFSMASFKLNDFQNSNTYFLFVEPGFIIKAGFEKCKLVFQGTFSGPIGAEEITDYDNFSVGLLIPFSSKSH